MLIVSGSVIEVETFYYGCECAARTAGSFFFLKQKRKNSGIPAAGTKHIQPFVGEKFFC